MAEVVGNRAARRAAARRRARKGIAAASGGAMALSGLGSLVASPAGAATFTVTNLNDSGAGSLRQALADAATDPFPDVITFSPDVRGTITLTSGELLVDSEVDIVGPGASRLTVSGNGASTVFSIVSDAYSVEISGVTISGGSGDQGGGIHSTEVGLQLVDVRITGNDAQSGAGIDFQYGYLLIDDSVIDGNTAGDDGGGVFAEYAFVGISASTVSGNTAGRGGGVYVRNGYVATNGATISGNTASDGVGGIGIYDGPMILTETTVSGNTAPAIGGVYVGNQGYLRHSTVTGNTATIPSEVDGVFAASANLVGVENSIVSGNGNGDSDLVGNTTFGGVKYSIAGTATPTVSGPGVLVGVDPRLGPLQDNGGPTFTHRLLTGSPAIDAGDPAFDAEMALDQRGFGPRDLGGRTDMGAIEDGASDPSSPPATTTTTTAPPPPPAAVEELPEPDENGDRSQEVATSEGPVVVTTQGSEGDGTVTVTVRESSDVADEVELNGFRVLDKVYEIEISEGASFSEVTVCLPYADEDLAAAGLTVEELTIFHFRDDGTREAVETTVDTEANTVCGTVSSLSPFAIGALATERLAGTTAAGTAAAISAARFDPGVDTAYLVTSEGFADALGAGPAAAAADSPVLLVSRDALPADTAEELDRLNPARIVVIGGTGVIGDDVATAAAAHGTVTRVAGADRYDTAAQLSRDTFEPGVDVAYVVTGAGFADGLVAGAAAAATGGPVLLATRDALPGVTSAELARLAPERIVVVGGTAGVSAAVEAELAAIAPTTRLAGADRYATAAAVAADRPVGTPVVVATGDKASDGLAGIPLAAADGAALVLVRAGEIPAAVADALTTLAPPTMAVLGGTAAIAFDTEVELAGFLPEDAS